MVAGNGFLEDRGILFLPGIVLNLKKRTEEDEKSLK
jgi:hypothetical protein